MGLPLTVAQAFEFFIAVDAPLMTPVKNPKLVSVQLLTEFWTSLNICPVLLSPTMLDKTISLIRSKLACATVPEEGRKVYIIVPYPLAKFEGTLQAEMAWELFCSFWSFWS